MIFDPEYAGVCSWRIVWPPAVYTSVCPSGDQPSAVAFSACVTRVSLPSLSERVKMSFRPRVNATRLPSGDTTMFCSGSGVVHTGDAAPPSTGTRQRSPSFDTNNVRLSRLQNAPFRDGPAPGSALGSVDVFAP